MKKHVLAAVIYNMVVTGIVLARELITKDTTGQGLAAIPALLLIVAPVHAVVAVWLGWKRSIGTAFWHAIGVLGMNVVFMFIDFGLILLLFNGLNMLGIIS